jgi:nucleoid-associated protein YgaU
MTRVGTIAKGLGSLLVVALIVIGVPLVLVRIGAFPTTVPSLTGIWEGLSRPDLTGQGGVFVVLAILTWGCWAAFTLSLLREIPAAVRSRGQRAARPLPGLSWSARPAALLVAAIVAMFVAAPLLTAAAPVAAAASLHNGAATPMSGRGTVATATHHPTTPANATPAAAHHASSTGSSAEAHPGASLSTSRSTSRPATSHSYTVKRHDTLWSIAEKQLGDPLRYTEIATLNPHIGPSHEIHVGLKLLLPTGAHAAADTHPAAAASTTPSSAASLAATEVVVEQGDTLSGLAAEHGVADWKAKVWPANAVRAEPGGKHLTDPNHIEVGWHLTVPGAATPTASPHAPTAGTPVTPAATAPTPSAAMAPPHTPVAHDPDATRLTPDTEDPAGQVAPASTGQPSTPAEASATAAPQQRPVANAASAEQSRSSTQQPAADFAAGGWIAAAAVLAALVLLRRQQFRNRRPGRTVAAARPELVPFERAAVTDGGPVAGEVQRLDEVLRRAARVRPEGLPVAAVQLHDDAITVHLASPVQLPAPWTAGEGTEEVWTFPADTPTAAAGPDPEEGDIGPFPTLVHLGSNAAGEWLLDLERAGGLILDGHRGRCLEVARVLAAQFALNNWSDMVSVTVVGFGQELAEAAPGRVRYADPANVAAVMAAAGKEAQDTADTMDRLDIDIVQARVQAACDELWAPQVILVAEATEAGEAGEAGDDPDTVTDSGVGVAAVTALLGTVDTRPNRTGTAVVVVAGRRDQQRPGMLAQVDADGNLTIPSNGLVVAANRWDAATSEGVSLLLAHARTAPDQPIPDAAGQQPWHAFSDQAGALRDPLVQPRRTPDVHDSDIEPAATCTLPMADEVYLDAAATTTEDLATLAPSVPVGLRSRVEDADPTLDADVASWFDPNSPTVKLSLLGPVTVHVPGKIPDQIAQSTDIIAYLATREHGATNDTISEAFGVAETTARKYVAKARILLGTRPDTGKFYIPKATETPAGIARGMGVYQIGGLLVDADLFRRLRLRGDTRGPEGINDYATALRLVSGTPFSQMRGSRGAWLIQGDRIDFHLKHAIVDVAHLLATQALATGDTSTARVAVDIARLASPDEETARLDNVAVTTAEGLTEQARRQLLDEVCNRTDDGQPPYDLNDRSRQILARHRDWLSRAS